MKFNSRIYTSRVFFNYPDAEMKFIEYQSILVWVEYFLKAIKDFMTIEK